MSVRVGGDWEDVTMSAGEDEGSVEEGDARLLGLLGNERVASGLLPLALTASSVIDCYLLTSPCFVRFAKPRSRSLPDMPV